MLKKLEKNTRKNQKAAVVNEIEEDIPSPVFTHTYNILHSLFPMMSCTSTIIKVRIQIDFVHTLPTFPTILSSKVVISGRKGLLHKEGFTTRVLLIADQILDALSSVISCTVRRKK